MSTPVQQGDWCAHVTYLDGSIKELTFDSPSGNRHVATKYVVDYLKLTGVNDPSIRAIRLQEIGAPNRKPHYYGKSEQPKTMEVTKDTSDSKWAHQYVVTLFVNPQVTTPRIFRIKADNPLIALNAARGMAGVAEMRMLGPYCVQEEIPVRDIANDVTFNTLVTKMVKGAEAFPKAGPLNTYGSIPDRPKVNQTSPVPVTINKREEFISEVINILKQETTATRRAYSIKQDT